MLKTFNEPLNVVDEPLKPENYICLCNSPYGKFKCLYCTVECMLYIV